MKFSTSIYLSCLFLCCHVDSQNILSVEYKKYPECLEPEDSGFCTPVTRYTVMPPKYRDDPGSCTNFSYYGEGGTVGFDSYQDCVYACSKGPLTNLIYVSSAKK